MAVIFAGVGDIGAGLSHLSIDAGDPVKDIGFGVGVVAILILLVKALWDGRAQVEGERPPTNPRSP